MSKEPSATGSGRILALDYGSKRIGIAISDPSQTVAFPRTILQNTSQEAVLKALKQLIEEEGVVAIVVGLPLNMQGQPTPQTQSTQTFLDELKKHINQPIHTADERLTSLQAERWGGDDAMAAQILLQSHLDRIQNERKG